MDKLKKRLYTIIFESDTRAGKIFDEVLLGIILLSVIVVMFESVENLRIKYGYSLRIIEWVITIIFTVEYFIRIRVSSKPVNYIFSFYGLIDLLAIIPTFLSVFLSGGHSLIIIRAIRLLRIFRIFKLTRYNSAGRIISRALMNNREKITVFIFFVLILAIIIGTLMYLIEGSESGFTDIPTSIYWAIVTLTTVGYGDLSPVTGLGKFLSSLVMLLGYSIIAVPTGIITADLLRNSPVVNTKVCAKCMFDKHDDDARFCKKCGTSMD